MYFNTRNNNRIYCLLVFWKFKRNRIVVDKKWIVFHEEYNMYNKQLCNEFPICMCYFIFTIKFYTIDCSEEDGKNFKLIFVYFPVLPRSLQDFDKALKYFEVFLTTYSQFALDLYFKSTVFPLRVWYLAATMFELHFYTHVLTWKWHETIYTPFFLITTSQLNLF